MTMPEIQRNPPARLRPAEPRDAARLKQLAGQAYRIHAAVLPRPPQAVTDDYAALIADDAVYVAEADSDLAGLIVLLPLHNALLLHAVAVAPEAQRRGIGGLLLRYAIEHARGQGLGAVEASVEKALLPLLGWFGRFGFDAVRSPGPGGYQRYYLRRTVS